MYPCTHVCMSVEKTVRRTASNGAGGGSLLTMPGLTAFNATHEKERRQQLEVTHSFSHSTVPLYSIILYSVLLHYTLLYSILLYYTILHSIIFHYITLYSIIPYLLRSIPIPPHHGTPHIAIRHMAIHKIIGVSNSVA